MANVVGSVAGGDPVRMEAYTVADVREELGLGANYTATVDGDTQGNDYELSDDQYVCFAAAVKGGISK